jgi:hypothetical protein
MGIDRFNNFILRSINNSYISEEIPIDNNIKKVISNHIIFDINSFIYNEIILIENEINDIIKIILSIKQSEKLHIIEDLLIIIFKQSHWSLLYDKFFDNDSFILLKHDNILKYFISLVNDNINIIIYNKLIKTIKNNIINLHIIEFIKSINIFIDGIPSLSKIIEQRRRRIKNYLESIEKKKLFKEYFDNLQDNALNNKTELISCLSNKKIIDDDFIDNNKLYFNYFTWVENRFTIDKSIGPTTPFIFTTTTPTPVQVDFCQTMLCQNNGACVELSSISGFCNCK